MTRAALLVRQVIRTAQASIGKTKGQQVVAAIARACARKQAQTEGSSEEDVARTIHLLARAGVRRSVEKNLVRSLCAMTQEVSASQYNPQRARTPSEQQAKQGSPLPKLASRRVDEAVAFVLRNTARAHGLVLPTAPHLLTGYVRPLVLRGRNKTARSQRQRRREIDEKNSIMSAS